MKTLALEAARDFICLLRPDRPRAVVVLEPYQGLLPDGPASDPSLCDEVGAADGADQSADVVSSVWKTIEQTYSRAPHFETFRDKLPSYHEFFSFKTVAYLWVALGVVKIIHEFGHGLTAKHFGGEVHEMGMLFLVLTPALYCDVTDSWLLPSKWKRIWISAAGIYVECFLASLAN